MASNIDFRVKNGVIAGGRIRAVHASGQSSSFVGAAGQSANIIIQSDGGPGGAGGSAYWLSAKHTDGALHIGANGGTEPAVGAIVIGNSGTVSVGTTANLNYGAKFRVHTAVNQYAAEFYSTGVQTTIVIANDNNLNAIGSVAGDMTFYTNAGGGTLTERMRIMNSGFVGIGVASPSVRLDVNGSLQLRGGGTATLLNGDNSNYYYLQNAGASGGANAFLAFTQGGAGERMRLDASGNLGLGTSSAAYRAHIASSSPSAVGVFRDLDVTSAGAAGTFIDMGARNGSTFVAGAQIVGVLNNPATTGFLTFNVLDTTMKERMRITAAGLVGVGTVSPASLLSSSNNSITVEGSAGADISLRRTSGSANIAVGVTSSDVGYLLSNSFTPIVIGTNGAERVRVDGLGNVGIGTTSPSSFGVLAVSKDLGTNNIVTVAVSQPNTAVGAAHGAEFAIFEGGVKTGWLRGYRDGSGKLELMVPGIAPLTFGTNTTERMRLTSSGDLLIGATTNNFGGRLTVNKPSLASIDVYSVDATEAKIKFFNSQNNSGIGNGTGGDLVFYANSANTERMRLNSAGDLLLGKTATDLTNAGFWFEGVTGSGATNNGRANFIKGSGSGTGATTAIGFYYVGTGVGSITTTSTTTTYNTTSDARLKKNIVDAPSASEKVMAMQVRSFDWISSDEHVVHGFIAQELQTVEPLAVSEGETWAIDTSKLVATLTKALQEALAEIESLKARVATLET